MSINPRLKERLEKKMPPKEVRQYIEEKTKTTYEINKGNLDKQSFRLGMYAMWMHLNKLNSVPNDERNATQQQPNQGTEPL